MRRAALTLALLLALPSVQAESVELSFRPPAQASPHVETSNGEWLLVLFQEGHAQAQMDWQAGGHGWNLTLERVRARYPPERGFSETIAETEAESDHTGPLGISLDFSSGGWASLYLEGDDLSLQADSASVDLKARKDRLCMYDLLTIAETLQQSARAGDLCPPGDHAMASVRPTVGNLTLPFKVDASQVRVAEWHNAGIACTRDPCPAGGERSRAMQSVAAGVSAGREVRAFQRLSADHPARIQASGQAMVILTGSGSLDLAVDGQLRLPMAAGSSACDGCLTPDGRTLKAEGKLTLTGLRMGPDGTLSGSLQGAASSLRLDEAAIDPTSLFGIGGAVAATTAAVGLAWLVKAFLWPLFTRLRPEHATRHDSRRRLLDYIERHPGASHREAARGTQMSPSSARHHVRMLLASGHLVEQRQGRVRRLFPSRFATKQRTTSVLMREPTLAALRDMVQLNPWLAQNDLMDLAQRDLGWSRSTTQHRLNRLVAGGLVVIRKQGRFKLHHVAESLASFPSVKAIPANPPLV